MPPIATYDMAIPNGTSFNGQSHAGDEPSVNGSDGQIHQLTTNGVNGFHTASTANKQGNHGTEKKEHSQYLVPSPADTEYDMICIGFGPAGLAIATALHDKLASEPDQALPKVMFIEKQETFAWHAGMLLPGAKMQISFIKDLATLRDPRSRFTFVNYLHSHGRLVDFTNLDTFLPNRSEYADYMRWCASYFQDVVQYGQQVLSVSPDKNKGSPLRSFTVKAMDAHTGRTQSYRGRNVVFANGGQPRMPKLTPEPSHPRIIHSSQYAYKARQILPDTSAPYQVAVIGAGQSAAEIFCNVQSSYPNAKVWLVMRQEFLRPSDDSPFVNSIFNPDFTDSMFDRPAHRRICHISDARATNYGVVRLNLLEHMYEHMYEQKRHYGPDERVWPHRILGGAHITSVRPRKEGSLSTEVQRVHANDEAVAGQGEHMEADLIIAATGYKRNAHIDMLQESWNLLPRGEASKDQLKKQGVTGWDIDTADGPRRVAVGRDYKVQLEPGSVAQGSGIWLQGCCEGTHGLSDTLLSVLATRSGEIVESIFGDCS